MLSLEGTQQGVTAPHTLSPGMTLEVPVDHWVLSMDPQQTLAEASCMPHAIRPRGRCKHRRSLFGLETGRGWPGQWESIHRGRSAC